MSSNIAYLGKSAGVFTSLVLWCLDSKDMQPSIGQNIATGLEPGLSALQTVPQPLAWGFSDCYSIQLILWLSCSENLKE